MSRAVPITQDQLPISAWSKIVPIHFGQCDPAGIVYTPNFFDIFNTVMEDWFSEHLGIDYHAIIRDRRIGMGYAHAASDFFIPVLMSERLDVFVIVKRVGNASYTLNLHAMKGGKEAVRGEFVAVTTSLETHKPIGMPDDIKTALVRYEAAQEGFVAVAAQ
ncbi:MAG: acyl-CoA thioesterase [Devosia nanyangense]|jgi:4-hydroxybenzoyl-CoA thioesterase/acyl-CoA thioester hydrolase|uniref:Acyl-CoA thioesterase n=1 Tax=Paradevosia shaoguanensis TaxID=1335043 RepID=A0AA41QKQ2_9HYPH|nr:thioesterase family protein [Paradevosia shaoguanensis]MBI4048635.1 acyl-CoA thioesterase [Devosia nanyangense]MCF1741046.1 acyl-CoA thioesterase [Paradevosia shaoguanensis]MCI0125529.1 acyl-CoA thioesterase [Paradevosia shaoguanensis]